MMSKKFTMSVLCGAIALFSACSKSSSNQQAGSLEDSFVNDLEVGELALQETLEQKSQKNKVRAKIKNNEKILSSDLVDLVVEEHATFALHFGHPELLSAADMNKKILELSSGATSKDPSDLKVAYESKLEETGKIKYNLQAVSIMNILRDLRLQCYSGTIMNIIAYKRSLGGRTDVSRVPVVIFTKGHIQPGYIVKKNGKDRLYGIETTVGGRAVVDFGYTSELLEKVQAPVRVVTMNDFLLVEALKHQIKLTKEQHQKMIQTATSKLVPFGLKVTELEARVGEAMGYDAGTAKVESHPFAFGKPDATDGDKDRDSFDIDTPDGSSVELIPENSIAASDESDYDVVYRRKAPNLSYSNNFKDYRIVEVYKSTDSIVIHLSDGVMAADSTPMLHEGPAYAIVDHVLTLSFGEGAKAVFSGFGGEYTVQDILTDADFAKRSKIIAEEMDSAERAEFIAQADFRKKTLRQYLHNSQVYLKESFGKLPSATQFPSVSAILSIYLDMNENNFRIELKKENAEKLYLEIGRALKNESLN